MAPVTSAQGLAGADSSEGGEAAENQTELLKHEWHHSRGTSARRADCVHNPGTIDFHWIDGGKKGVQVSAQVNGVALTASVTFNVSPAIESNYQLFEWVLSPLVFSPQVAHPGLTAPQTVSGFVITRAI